MLTLVLVLTQSTSTVLTAVVMKVTLLTAHITLLLVVLEATLVMLE